MTKIGLIWLLGPVLPVTVSGTLGGGIGFLIVISGG